MTFRRVAVLNRGDAAMRFIRTARELAAGSGPSLEVVAVHTDPDADAPFVRLADDTIALGPALQRGPGGNLQPAYCLHDLVLERLTAAGCDAVWPGWGFVSEDADFVARLEQLGITFIGPPSLAMRELGDKVRAKELAEACGVPLAPWAVLDRDGTPESWRSTAEPVGYPLMVKAANGGGGRGIRRVDEPADLADAVRSVRSEAESAFGPGMLFVERCVLDARHVEVQFVVGVDGRADTLGVRDCSIQRRHQKVIEEAPSPVLSPVEEARLTASTARLAEAAGYRGVGTAEFLYVPSTRSASFCEVNARLQVEHTVTEMVWGVDLVRAQIEIAAGRTHERSAGARGWAVEARVVAEDAERGFAPAPGRVLVHRPAAGPNVRVDAGVRAGSDIPTEFDSMIAKVLAWGPTRDRAMATLARAVSEYEVLIEDGSTNRGVLLDLLGRDEVVHATATTTWMESVADLGHDGRRSGELVALAVAAIELASSDRAARVHRYFTDARSGVPAPDPAASRPVEVELSLRGTSHRLSVSHRGGARWIVGPAGSTVRVDLERLDATAVVVQLGDRTVRALLHRSNGAVTVDVEGSLHRVRETDVGVVRSPGPALLVALDVAVGDQVVGGQRIGTLEAMKTEAPLVAECAGVVERALVAAGSHVAAGDPIVVLRPSQDEQADGAAGDGDSRGWAALGADRVQPGTAAWLTAVIDAVVLGFEVPADDVDAAIDALDGMAGTPVGDGDDLVGRLWTFVQVESLFERNLLLLDDLSAAVSAESAFHDLCRRCAAGGVAEPLSELAPLLSVVLEHYGIDRIDCDAGDVACAESLRAALWRLAGTRARVAERERLMVALVRALAARARTGQEPATSLLSALGTIELVASGSMTGLADAAVFVRSELGAAGTGVRELSPGALDPSSITALCRYEDVEVRVLDAVGTDAGRSVVTDVTSRLDPEDRRTVLAIEMDDAPEDLDELDEAGLARFAELFEAGVALLRRHRDRHAASGDRDSWWAALHLVLRGVQRGGAASLLALSHRFEPGTRGLALQEFTVALVPEAGASTLAPSIEFSLRRRGHARLEVEACEGVIAARPRTALDRRALTAKRLGVVDPWEMIGLIQGRVRAEDLPHPSLAEGRFVEHDLDPAGEGLVAVERPPAEHRCSVIVGTVANPLPGRREWAERVLVAGDPLRSMGSLGEAECRRIVAAIDLAESRRIPLEWLALSSGARIAWDSGTENLDWTAAVLRRIVEFTTAGGEINVVMGGISVGAQSYWNAEATMLMHTRGILVMTPNASMVLTGKRALEFSGSVGAQDEIGIGGHDRIMGPNGQAQYRADDLADAYAILLEHYTLTYALLGDEPVSLQSADPVDRDVCCSPYKGGDESFATVGEIFDAATNPGRKRPFAIRAVMGALADADSGHLERWRTMADADGAVVWETRVGGHAVTMVGIESRPRPRAGVAPVDGPGEWAGATLYPASSKKVARALRAASGNRPVVILANLSGFDGSPESLRRLQLEYGAEIARAVIEFDGPIVFSVIGRYHGGAYVVFSKRLHPRLTAIAVEGSYASVIGGAPAAAVVLTRDVRERAAVDPGLLATQEALAAASSPDERLRLLERLDAARADATARARAAVAAEFDAVHTVERAVQVGSLDAVIPASRLRPAVIAALK